jgi:hypothetical protein
MAWAVGRSPAGQIVSVPRLHALATKMMFWTLAGLVLELSKSLAVTIKNIFMVYLRHYFNCCTLLVLLHFTAFQTTAKGIKYPIMPKQILKVIILFMTFHFVKSCFYCAVLGFGILQIAELQWCEIAGTPWGVWGLEWFN